MAKKDTIVGLDIGRHSAKAVWMVVRGGRPSVTGTATLPLPMDSTDPAPVIRPWLEQEGVGKRSVVIGISGGQAMFQPIALPPDDPRSEEQAAGIEVVKYNEMVQDTMVYGYAPFALHEGDRRLLLSMARPGVLDDALGFVRGLGLSVVDIVPTPVALFNGLAPDEPSEEVCLYLNMGASGTEVAVGRGRQLVFARSFSVGGRMFTDAVARERQITAGRARSWKESEGTLLGDDDPMAAKLRAVADLWLSELHSCLSIYRSLFPGRLTEPARVVLAGPAARLEGFVDYAAQQLELPVALAETCAGGPEAAQPGDFAVACGLALAGLESDAAHVSLLPAAVRHELLFRREKPYWIAAGVAALLALAVSLFGGYRDYRRKHAELRAQEDSLQRRQQLAAQIEGIRAQSDMLLQMARPVRDLLGAAPTLRDVVTLVSEAKDRGDWITLVCDADSYFNAGKEKAPPAGRTSVRDRPAEQMVLAPEGPVFQRIVIEGYTRRASLVTVKALIARLKAAAFIDSADLLSDDELVDVASPKLERRSSGRRFVIDVRVKTP